MTSSLEDRRILRPAALAFVMALGVFEGCDIASIGLTLSRITREFHLDPSQGGICASAGMLGLMVGAPVGGRLADIIGRRPILLGAMILLGVASFGSAWSWDFHSLLACRLLAGLGMGGVMPLLIAMAGESAAPSFRSTAISMLMASGAVGGIVAGLVSLHPDWHVMFYFGGIGPLGLIPIVALRWIDVGVPAEREAGSRLSFMQTLFEDGRTGGTLLLWVISFATTLVSYILINWLPSLLVRQGFSESDSHSAMIVYSLGGILGNLASGYTMDRGSPRLAYCLGYVGASACILGLTVDHARAGLYMLAFGVNFFMLGAQLVTLSLTPLFYPVEVRGTGLGAVVSAGRLGSVVGPLMVGELLHIGLGPDQLLIGLIPAFAVALALGLVFEAFVRARRGGVLARRDAATSH